MRVLTAGNIYPPHHLGGYELVWQGAVRTLCDAGHAAQVLTTDLRYAGVASHEEAETSIRTPRAGELRGYREVARGQHS